MAPVCQGECVRPDFPYNTKGGRGFEFGYKKCKTCCLFVDTVLKKCPCCQTNLRNRTRTSRLRKLRVVTRY